MTEKELLVQKNESLSVDLQRQREENQRGAAAYEVVCSNYSAQGAQLQSVQETVTQLCRVCNLTVSESLPPLLAVVQAWREERDVLKARTFDSIGLQTLFPFDLAEYPLAAAPSHLPHATFTVSPRPLSDESGNSANSDQREHDYDYDCTPASVNVPYRIPAKPSPPSAAAALPLSPPLSSPPNPNPITGRTTGTERCDQSPLTMPEALKIRYEPRTFSRSCLNFPCCERMRKSGGLATGSY